MAGKGHGPKKAKKGAKASKRKAAERKARAEAGEPEAPNSVRAPKLASSGRALKARARTAEREQRRLHGAPAAPRPFPCSRDVAAQHRPARSGAIPQAQRNSCVAHSLPVKALWRAVGTHALRSHGGGCASA